MTDTVSFRVSPMLATLVDAPFSKPVGYLKKNTMEYGSWLIRKGQKFL
jgi:hypothetical protein